MISSGTKKRDVTTDQALQAAAVVIEQARKQGIEWAIAGGVAMQLYGFLRATQDVDLLASATLEIVSERKLSFGGESYLVQVGERRIMVDVIVRDDFFRDFYEAALRDAQTNPEGWRVVTPEWMLILKYLAGRGKDQIDLLWMLREPGLVDRDLVTKLLEQVMGQVGAQVALRGLEPLYIQAQMVRGGDENGE